MPPGSEIRYALRSLRREPGFAGIVIFVLMLAIAANTAIFSVVYASLLRQLPYTRPERLCLLWKSVPKKQIERDWTSYPTLLDWKNRSRWLEDMAAVLRPEGARVTLTGGETPEEIQAAKVSANFFAVLGARPMLGRTFTSEDGRARANVAVWSYGGWMRRLGGDPRAVGRRIEIDGEPVEVIGVMPASVQFPNAQAEAWLLMEADTRWPRFQQVRVADAFCALARLRPEASFAQARAGMQAISAELGSRYAATDANLGVTVVPLREQLVGRQVRLALWILFGAVGLVWLIACANVGSLFWSRGVARQGEFAIRSALGAGRGRLAGQLLTEALVLAVPAGACGIALTGVGLRALKAAAPAGVPLDGVRMDGAVLAFHVGISVLAGVLAALAPAMLSTRAQALDALKQASRGSTGGRGAAHVHRLLVFVECGLAMVVLVGAGLLARSFVVVQGVDLGFRADRLSTMRIAAPHDRYGEEVRSRAFFEQVIREVRAIPGVVSAAVGGVFFEDIPNTRLTVEGRPAGRPGEDSEPSSWEVVSDGYFQTLGVPLLGGRNFSSADTAGTAPVAIINRSMARHLWPGENPVGRRFRYGLPGLDLEWLTVVGICGDISRNGPESRPIAIFYRPLGQRAFEVLNVVVRSSGDARVAAAIEERVHGLDRMVPRFRIEAMEERLAALNAPRRFETELLGLFAAVALILAVAGIYGVTSYTVAKKRAEIGLRMALGARPEDVMRWSLRQGMAPALAGTAAGLAGSFALGHFAASLLYGVSPSDPATLAGVAGLLMGAAAMAAYLPARRAARVDPMGVLRSE